MMKSFLFVLFLQFVPFFQAARVQPQTRRGLRSSIRPDRNENEDAGEKELPTMSFDSSWRTLTVSASLAVQIPEDSDEDRMVYLPTLVKAVDNLALETASVLRIDWTGEINTTNAAITRQLQVQLPSNAWWWTEEGVPQVGCRAILAQDSPTQGVCEDVGVSMELRFASDIEAPSSLSDAFLDIFQNAVRHGRLQRLVERVSPSSPLKILLVPPPLVGGEDTDFTQEPQNFLGNRPGDESPSNSESASTSTAEDGTDELNLMLILGSVAGALVALAVCVLSLWVVKQTRYASKEPNEKGSQKETKLNKKKHPELEIQAQETDLVETFSEAGLEWGGTPPNALLGGEESSQDESHFVVKDDDDDSWKLPANLRLSPNMSTPDSQSGAMYMDLDKFSLAPDTNTPQDSPSRSVSTTSSYLVQSTTNSIVDYSPMLGQKAADPQNTSVCSSNNSHFPSPSDEGTSLATSQETDDVGVESRRPAASGIKVNLDGLEDAILQGDWETLAAAAHSILQHEQEDELTTFQDTEEGTTASMLSVAATVSRDWSQRPKTWQTKMDATKAATLDQLVTAGDWAGILNLATQFSSEQDSVFE